MKDFKTFLMENINEIEGGLGPDETFIHVNDEGDVVVENTEDGFFGGNDPEDEFDMFYSDEDEDAGNA